MDPTPSENAKKGNVKYFEEVEVDIIQNYRDKKNGDSVLSLVASSRGKLNCCKVIYKRCPQLLYEVNDNHCSVLHEAASSGRDDNVEFFLTAEGGGYNSRLLKMLDKPQNNALHYAVIDGHLQSAKLLLRADPSNALLTMDNEEKDTPMHLAVKNHELDCVKLLLDTDPACLYSLNATGKTPHTIALEESLKDDATKGTHTFVKHQTEPTHKLLPICV